MASRSASERLLRHLEASQSLGVALETYRVPTTSAIQPQNSLLESRRVAPGTPLGDILEARGRLFHEKIATRMQFYQISVRFCHERRFSHFWDRFLIDF